MKKEDADFLDRLLATFRVEAREHLGAISSGLIELEKGRAEARTELNEKIYRELHSLKGAARSVNLSDIVAICQSMEHVFASLKRGDIACPAPMFDDLHRAVDCIGRLVSGEQVSLPDKSEITGLIERLRAASKEAEPSEAGGEGIAKSEPGDVQAEACGPRQDVEITEHGPDEPPQHKPPMTAGRAHVAVPALSETIRISTSKLDALLLQAEELLSVKIATGQRAAELREMKEFIDAHKKEKAKARARAATLSSRGVAVAQKEASESGKKEGANSICPIEGRLASMVKAAEYDHRQFGAMVDNLLDNMKKALMLPVSSLTDMFPRFVRDLSREVGKDAVFTASGAEIEIDRRILEEMKDPLIHLVRNCIDHGIELPDVRESEGKPPRGEISISVASRDGKIEIAVSDDGAGIDIERIKSSALKHGALSQEEAGGLGEQEALMLIFRSGVTTSPIITDISGRGLGLAIVREKVEKLNGIVSVDTRPVAGTATGTATGTTIRMVVPLTLATFRGIIVRVSDRLFVLPSANVVRVGRVKSEEIRTVENRETLSLGGQAVSLGRLGDTLGLNGRSGRRPDAPELLRGGLKSRGRTPGGDSMIQFVVLGSVEKLMAFTVDEVLQEQEVLVKPLGRQLSRVRNIAGATVLGSGKVVPILNVPDLMKSALKGAAAAVQRPVEAAAEGGGESLLVVEDSITARTLLKNVLESGGYRVTTAVDGVEAFAALRTRDFSLVVSDVDMPRMNGFDLTAKIRADKKLSELPVVLVTALESREDREHGIDVGANAYIVKSSFDQSNLLEVVKRLT